jgi:cell division septation protein DedD
MTIIPPEVAVKDKKRIPLVWIPATLTIGLLIAALYLGGRIIAAHRPAHAAANTAAHTASSVPKVVPPQPPIIAPQVVAEVVKPEIKPELLTPEATEQATSDAASVITPHGGDLYIQLGAFNVEATRRFVQHLRSEKLEPLVAPGPKPEIMRVLIGPFNNRDALNERKAQLQTKGFDTFVRVY